MKRLWHDTEDNQSPVPVPVRCPLDNMAGDQRQRQLSVCLPGTAEAVHEGRDRNGNGKGQ